MRAAALGVLTDTTKAGNSPVGSQKLAVSETKGSLARGPHLGLLLLSWVQPASASSHSPKSPSSSDKSPGPQSMHSPPPFTGEELSHVDGKQDALLAVERTGLGATV